MATPVREVPRESREWAAVPVLTKAGVPVTSDVVKLAVLPEDVRPTLSDWVAPVPDPEGTAAYGVRLTPAGPGRFGVWAQIATTGGDSVVLEPELVGYVIRT